MAAFAATTPTLKVGIRPGDASVARRAMRPRESQIPRILAQSRFGEKEALSATDRARRRARSVDACGLDPSDRPISTLADLRRLILVSQVAFRGETSGLKRGKAVKVRQNPHVNPRDPGTAIGFRSPRLERPG